MASLVCRAAHGVGLGVRRRTTAIQAAPLVPGLVARPVLPGSSHLIHSECGSLLGRRVVTARAEPPSSSSSTEGPSSGQPQSADNGQLLFSLGIGALWLCLLAYAFLLAPNQTPYRDQIFLERILGIGEKDGFIVNPVFVGLFNIMGVYPAIYASLLVPAGRSENKVPAWPFVTLSFFLGAFALLPYMALWRPFRRSEDNPLPPPASELEGWNKLFLKGAETPVMPALLLAGSLYCIYLAATAGDYYWIDYLKLFDESRLVHVTTIDFATLTLLAPFWMELDASGRNWSQRGSLLTVLSFLPVVGPCIYLLLRPKAEQPK